MEQYFTAWFPTHQHRCLASSLAVWPHQSPVCEARPISWLPSSLVRSYGKARFYIWREPQGMEFRWRELQFYGMHRRWNLYGAGWRTCSVRAVQTRRLYVLSDPSSDENRVSATNCNAKPGQCVPVRSSAAFAGDDCLQIICWNIPCKKVRQTVHYCCSAHHCWSSASAGTGCIQNTRQLLEMVLGMVTAAGCQKHDAW